MILGLKYAVLATSNLDDTRALFERVTGHKVAFQDGQRWAEFRLPTGSRVAVASLEEAQASGPAVLPVFESDDLDGDVARLRDAGLHPTGGRDMGSHGRIVTFSCECGPFQLFGRRLAATPG